jgi:hypothetical protein
MIKLDYKLLLMNLNNIGCEDLGWIFAKICLLLIPQF